MAEIRLFNDTDFKGGEIRLTDSDSDLKNEGFGDRLSSVIVTSGTFTLYQDASFKGFSLTVSKVGGPNSDGRYPNPQSMGNRNDVISSVRKNSDQPL
jgi:Beta/Gamma crystallin